MIEQNKKEYLAVLSHLEKNPIIQINHCCSRPVTHVATYIDRYNNWFAINLDLNKEQIDVTPLIVKDGKVCLSSLAIDKPLQYMIGSDVKKAFYYFNLTSQTGRFCLDSLMTYNK